MMEMTTPAFLVTCLCLPFCGGSGDIVLSMSGGVVMCVELHLGV